MLTRKHLSPRYWIPVLALLTVVLVVGLMSPPSDADAEPAVPPLVWIEDGGLRYEFHLPTGSEGLYHVADDPFCTSNVIDDRPDEAKRLRSRLSERYDVPDIESLREHYKATTDALRSLGYL